MIDFVTGLAMSTSWRDGSHDSILVIFEQLTKMIHYEPIQITIDAPGLAEVILDVVTRHHLLSGSRHTHGGTHTAGTCKEGACIHTMGI